MERLNPYEIRENARYQTANQFSERIKNLQFIIKNKDEEIRRLKDLYKKAATELSELKAKSDMQEEWIARMQDFCNMSEEDRKHTLHLFR